MKKFKLSVIEKQVIRSLIIILVVQFMVIQFFVNGYKNSFPVDVNDTKYVDITVSDVLKVTGRHNSFIAVNVYSYLDGSDYTKFVFYQSYSPNEYRLSELYEELFPGNVISLRYVERRAVVGKKNVVVAAETDRVVYRTIEEYNKSREGSWKTVFFWFLIVELVFLIGSVLHICFEFKIIKGLARKIKKYFQRRFIADNKKA
jgi:hypothetical protein